MKRAKFVVLGEPRGKQRPRTVRNRATGRTMTYTPEQTVIYENMVRYAYQQQCTAENSGMLEGQIEAEIAAYFPIPKSESKKRKLLMLDEIIWHTKKPDADNIAKAVLDALNGVAYHDDTQIAKLTVEKKYSEQPRVVITLAQMECESEEERT